MPDPAFEETFRQFAGLIKAAEPAVEPEVRCYRIRSVAHSDQVLESASARYDDIESLYDDPPQALIITGCEPRCSDITREAYWDDLARLLRWAQAVVPSVALSCLASHAAVLALDGIRRVPLAAKQSGVYVQAVNARHFLSPGLGAQAVLPHSRLNDVPARALRTNGYRLLVSSASTGWSVATRERDGRVMVLLQGHPEYAPTTLLREYRRDVRRFLDGTYAKHPAVPVDYLDEAGVEILDEYRARCTQSPTASTEDFPYEQAAKHIDARWNETSQQLFVNWALDVRSRVGLFAS
jgi:homoserine O-succinyltransferase